MLRKPDETFVDEDLDNEGREAWPLTGRELAPHYDEVEALLKPQRFPTEREPYGSTPKTVAMNRAAAALGLEDSVEQPKLAIEFARASASPGETLEGQERNLYEVSRSTCRLCGECDIGCNYGAKSTLDLTILSDAVRHRARVYSCCEAVRIEPAEAGGYTVHYRHHLETRREHPESLLDPNCEPDRSVTAKQVVVAAGTIGTPRLLLKSRLALRKLSPALGERFSANGDYFAWIRNCRDPQGGAWRNLEPSRGPVITTSIRIDEERSASGREHYLQDAGAPPIADWFWQLAELPGNLWRARANLAKRTLDRLRGEPDSHESGMLATLFGDAHASTAMMPILAMGRDYTSGRLRLDTNGLELDWSRDPSRGYYDSVKQSLTELAGAMGGELMTDGLDLRDRAITVHPVGGCAMARDPRHGVVDPWGQVHGYPGLWIADGSVMPGPVGPNPSLTIAALADRFAGAMLRAM